GGAWVPPRPSGTDRVRGEFDGASWLPAVAPPDLGGDLALRQQPRAGELHPRHPPSRATGQPDRLAWAGERAGGGEAATVAAGHRQGVGDEALEAAAVAERVPIADPRARDAEAVVALLLELRRAPLRADHLAPAGDRQHAALRRGVELGVEAGEVARRADE